MKNFKILLLFSFLLPVLGCQENTSGQDNNSGQENSTEKSGENYLRDGVFVVHDEAMAQLGEVHRLKKQLRDISRDASVTLDSTTRERLTRVLVQLDDAGEGMMDWMASFKQPASLREQKSHDEIMAYLNGEKEKVEAVKKNIVQSVGEAKKLLAELKK